MKNSLAISVLETGHILKGSLASGDEWLEKVTSHLRPKYLFHIIIPEIGVQHWRRSRLKVNYSLLSTTPFDNKTNPILIFSAYLLRSWQAFGKLKSLPQRDIIYSSTDVLPDILPVYLFKKIHPGATWIAQIHHLYPPPARRPGNLFVNLISYLMQGVSLFCLSSTCDFLLVNNSLLQAKLIKMGFKKRKIKVLGAGVEYDKISKQKTLIQTKAYQGVYLGRLHTTKGIFDLVPIWKEVIKSIPQARLAIIGDGAEEVKQALKKQIQQNGLGEQIELLGFVPNEKAYSILKTAKVFLFTDREAGWGRAVAEAMTCGLPVVGYNLGILGSVYKEGFLTAPLGNTQKFALQVITLLTNEKKRVGLGEKACQFAASLDWNKTATSFDLYLEDILKKRVKLADEKILPKRLKLAEKINHFLRRPILKAVIVYFLWLYHKISKFGRSFYFQGKKYPYFYHRYNYTWLGERTVEIPIIWEIIKNHLDKRILEVGNVLPHYFKFTHDVLDKYEKNQGVINQDIISFKTSKKYDFIISISTLEHVGWDEIPKEPQKILRALTNLKKLLAPKGKVILTLPLGYNHYLDELLRTNRLGLTKKFCLKRVSKDNIWQETKWKDIQNAKYGEPFYCANGLVIGIIDND